MKHLQLIEKIKSDPFAAMTVTDISANGDGTFKNERIIVNGTAAKIKEAGYESIEDFFESIVRNGITAIRITERRKFGSTFVPKGTPFEFDLVSNTETEPTIEVKTETAAQPVSAMLDLNGFSGLNGGMNAIQIYHSMDYPRLHGEHSTLKAENERLKSEIMEMKLEALKRDNSKEKTAAQTELIDKLTLNAPGILTALGGLGLSFAKKEVASGGLAGSEHLSPTQIEVFEHLKGLDDQTIATIGKIAENTDNQGFIDDLVILLAKHQILQS